MKHQFEFSLCAAVASLALVCPQVGRAQTSTTPQQNSQTNSNAANTNWQTNVGKNGQSASTGANIGSQPGAQAGYGNGQAQGQANMGSQATAQTGKANGTWNQGARAGNSSSWAQKEASRMVPAQASLETTIDSKSAQPGEHIRAKLTANVQLKNGPELPNGTVLEGKVTQDQTRNNHVRLALAFNKAKLNDGRTIPVKAMVIGFTQQSEMGYENGPAVNKQTGQNNAVAPGRNNGYAGITNHGYVTGTSENAAQIDRRWNGDRLSVNQPNAIDGASLHSSVTSRNSAVLSANRQKAVKLSKGTDIALALARQPMQQGQPYGNPTM